MNFDMTNKNWIEIDLGNGFCLTAERNTNPGYEKEIFVGITKHGTWWQDLAVIRPTYTYGNHDTPQWSDDQFDVLVYGDKNNEDWTQNYIIGLYQDEQRETFAI